MVLGKRLTSLRNNKKKRQEDIAKIIGVTRPAYTAYEKGKRNPDYETLLKLASYFEVTVDYLLGKSDDPRLTEKEDKKMDKKTKDLLDLLDKLPKDRRDHYIDEITAYVNIKTHADDRGKD